MAGRWRLPSSDVRLLVVDDEVDLADAVATGLRREGYAVDVAHDGDEALDKASVNAYDLVCLDLTMPDIDGREVCRRVRAGTTLGPPAPGADADRPRQPRRPGRRASTTAPTTTWSSRSPSPSCRRGSARCCAASRRGTASVLEVGDLELDDARHEAPRGGRRARPHRQGVRAAALLHGPRRRGAVPGGRCSSTCGTSTPTRSPTPCGSPSARCAASSTAGGEPPPIETVIGRGYRLVDGRG